MFHLLDGFGIRPEPHPISDVPKALIWIGKQILPPDLQLLITWERFKKVADVLVESIPSSLGVPILWMLLRISFTCGGIGIRRQAQHPPWNYWMDLGRFCDSLHDRLTLTSGVSEEVDEPGSREHLVGAFQEHTLIHNPRALIHQDPRVGSFRQRFEDQPRGEMGSTLQPSMSEHNGVVSL